MMNKKSSGFIAFEKAVVESILSYSRNEHISKNRQQYNRSIVTSREFTGVGFYTNFSIVDKSLYLDDVNFEIGGIHAEIQGLKNGAGFVLFIRNGIIQFLEGYSYGETWPGVITQYHLSIIREDGSLIDLPQEK